MYQKSKKDKFGRYPVGFRHYESFANYSQTKRDATMQEYMNEMNRPCEFHEYCDIWRAHLIEESQSPEFQHEFRAEITREYLEENNLIPKDEEITEVHLGLLDDDYFKKIQSTSGIMWNVREYTQSDDFIKECRRKYSMRIQEALDRRETFMLVEALEDTVDFFDIDGDLVSMPLNNTYIPVRNTIMKKPNLLDEDLESDELGYLYQEQSKKDETRQRLHPMEQLSPLRSNRMGPAIHKAHDQYKNKFADIIEPKARFSKWRKLSKNRSNTFSTMVERPQSRAGQPMLMSNSLVGASNCGVSLPNRIYQIPTLAEAFSPFRQ